MEFLNDTVIDLYLKKLEQVRISRMPLCTFALQLQALHCVLTRPALQELSGELGKRVHFFNTFFFKKLSQRHVRNDSIGDGAAGGTVNGFKPGERAAHDRVKKWTKHVDIFSKARSCAPGAQLIRNLTL